MLMFLGEYFKGVIMHTNEIQTKIDTKGGKKTFSQEKFFITDEIMDSLGTACKLYMQNLRQELRLSIALCRNPEFEGELTTELNQNIRHI